MDQFDVEKIKSAIKGYWPKQIAGMTAEELSPLVGRMKRFAVEVVLVELEEAYARKPYRLKEALSDVVNELRDKYPSAYEPRGESQEKSDADVLRDTHSWLKDVPAGPAGDAVAFMRKYRQDWVCYATSLQNRSPNDGELKAKKIMLARMQQQKNIRQIIGGLIGIGVSVNDAKDWAEFAVSSEPDDFKRMLEDIQNNGIKTIPPEEREVVHAAPAFSIFSLIPEAA